MPTLNMAAEFNNWEIILEGGNESFTLLAETFETCSSEAVFVLRVPSNVQDPSDTSYLKELRVRCAKGRVNIFVNSSQMVISGAPSNLQHMAHNFRFFVKQISPSPPTKGYHMHMEYYEDHPWLAKNAVPLILEPERS